MAYKNLFYAFEASSCISVFISFLLVCADDRNLTESLCVQLKEKHVGCPIIFFLDENDISTANHLSSKYFLRKLTDFHIISAFSPIVENLVRLKKSGFDFDEMEFNITEENCLWVNLFLRYRNSSAIQDFCRSIGKSLRKDVSPKCLCKSRNHPHKKLLSYIRITFYFGRSPLGTILFASRKKNPPRQFLGRNRYGLILPRIAYLML